MSERFKSIETIELVKIANAIRTKTGTTDKISLEEMPARIKSISSEGGSAQSDWNAKEGEPGHILNRTHFTEKIDPNFDNDSTGREVLPIATDVNIVKITDYVLTEEECIGAEVSFVMDGQAPTLPITANGVVDLTSTYGISCFMATPDEFLHMNLPFVAVVRESGTVQGTTVSAGTYYVSASNPYVYVSHFNALENVTYIHKLDNKYLDMEWIPKDVEVEIVPTTYTTFKESSRADKVESDNINSEDLVTMPASAVVFGDSYVFYINEKKYTTKCYDPNVIDPELTELGVSAIFSDGDIASSNTYNIGVIYYASHSTLQITVAGVLVGSVPVRITKATTSKIPERFLPDSVAAKAYVDDAMEALELAIDGKADADHTHTMESIDGLQEAVNAAADSKFYVVTFDQGSDGEYHGDLTFAEIREKFEAGGNMVARIDGTDYIPLLSAAPHQIIFSGIYQSQSVALTITANDVCTLTTTKLAQASHSHSTASTTAAGFMSKEDKIKLNDIETKAEVNIIESIRVNGEEVPVTDKTVNITIPEQTQVQSDWNQNDEAASDYVKNRPFYDNTEVLLDTITVNNGDTLDFTVGSFGNTGDVVSVIWDGVLIDKTIGYCEAESGQWNLPYDTIGNQSYIADTFSNGGDDTGEEYVIYSGTGASTSTVVCDDQSHTLSIVKGSILQIDEKFIPDTIARVSDVDEKIDDAIANIPSVTSAEAKLPITLGAFQYFKWGDLPGDSVEEQAHHLAKYSVIVYQGALADNLSMAGDDYDRDLALYTKALEYNPDLKVFGYVTARGFATNKNTGGHVGMTEYRKSPSNVDHPIWTKEELAAYINLMAHCGGTRDTSTTDEFGNPVLTGGIPLYGVFFDDYDYHFEDDNTSIINQGDWNTVREKHNFLIDYVHSCGMQVMPNSNPHFIFSSEATPNSVRNPDGIESHMNENDWFCGESYFMRSDHTFSLTDNYVTEYNENYRDTFKSKCLLLSYTHAVDNDAEDNIQIASTFALYQALCQGADAIALHGTDCIPEIPEEFTKYYDKNNNAIRTKGDGYYGLTVNGHTILAVRDPYATKYGQVPNAAALATCKVIIDGQHAFNNICVRSEEMLTKLSDINKEINDLNNKVEQSSNLYHRAFIDDWEKNYTISDYTNYAFTFENAFGGEETGSNSSWNAANPYDFKVFLPQLGSWRRVTMDAKNLAGKTIELGFEKCEAYMQSDNTTKLENVMLQIHANCDSNSWLQLAAFNVNTLNKSSIDNIERCCIKITLPSDIKELSFWAHRTTETPTGTWVINAEGTYLVDTAEHPIKKTWFTNYAPQMSSWGAMGNWSNYEILRNGDKVTTRYTAKSGCYESGVYLPENKDIFKAGETWELGFKDIRMTRSDSGDVSHMMTIMCNIGTNICPDIYITGKTYNEYKNMKSVTGDDSLIAIARFTIPESYIGGMPSTPLYVYPHNYMGGDDIGLYSLNVEGLYLYKIDEQDELFIRGEDLSDTYIALNRVRTDTIDAELKPDSLYIVDDGSMFITDFRGDKVDIVKHGNDNDDVLIQPDWNQNDESAADYIKNKPFYDNTEVTLDTITVNNGDTLDVDFVGDIGDIGDTATIIWDGIALERVVSECDVIYGNWSMIHYTIGNQALLNNADNAFEDTGEEFLIKTIDGGDGTVTVNCDSNSHTVSIVHGTLKQIENKFIPDAVARKSYVDNKSSGINENGNWFIGENDTGLKASDLYHRAFYDEWENPNAKRTWYTNYAPSMTEWKLYNENVGIEYVVDEDGDGVTINYLTADEVVNETGLVIPANSDILQQGETWEVGVKEFYAYDDDGNDVTNKCQIYFQTDSLLGFNHYNTDSSFYENSVSSLHPSLRMIKRCTIGTNTGMPESKLIVKATNYTGGTVREDGSLNCYHIRVKGFYIYKADEREELNLRGVDSSDTYIKINRVTPDTINDTIEPNALYLVDNGSIFATNFQGDRIDLGGGAQADWNAKEGEPGHILNRTHYKIEEDVELASGNYTSALTEFGVYGCPVAYHTSWEPPRPNEFVISFDGVEYRGLIPSTVTGLGTLAGNFAMLNALLGENIFENTGEPFLAYVGETSNAIVFTMDTSPTSHEIKIAYFNFALKKLDRDFLPDSVANWNAANGDAGYVQNRTHWIEFTPEVVLPEKEYYNTAFEEYGWIFSGNVDGDEALDEMQLVEGETYVVTYKGTVYECVCKLYDLDGEQHPYLGNKYLIDGGEDTREPFAVETGCITIADTVSEYVSIGIEHMKESVRKLPEKFLPETAVLKKDIAQLSKVEWLPVREERTEPEVLFDIAFSITSANTTYNLNTKHGIASLPIEAGMSVKVLFDGVEYVCTAVPSNNYSFSWWLGDGSKNSAGTGVTESTGEPFLLMARKSDGLPVLRTVVGDHTMSMIAEITQLVPVPMPEEFLPESVDGVVIRSSTEGSTKKFKLTIDDSGNITATELT